MNAPHQIVAKRLLSASGRRTWTALPLLLAFAACSGDGTPTPAPAPTPTDILCKDYEGKQTVVKPKTITIYNNSDATIYPIVSTSKNAKNEWIQGCLRTSDPYPTNFVYKLYVNEGEGIPPDSSVTITLPLYSQLSSDRYITWWNGGRVVLADGKDRLRDQKDALLTTPGNVSCKGQKTACKLHVYSSDVQFPENIFAQLSEYTFGDSIIPPGQSLRVLIPDNVGYNISYVDHVYMPVAIEPSNNPYIGYSGSTLSLNAFRDHLTAFLTTPLGQGWPVYNLSQLKLPGGYNIFAQRFGTLPPADNVPVKPANGFPPVLTVLPCIKGQCTEDQKTSVHFGASVQRMQDLWASCVPWNEDLTAYQTKTINCPQNLRADLTAVQQFFKENHQQYLQMFAAGQCDTTSTPTPVPFDFWQAINHVYGWVPFNEGCGASANPLVETTIPGWDHAKIQSMYIHDLQYNYKDLNVTSELLFNPYVKLIHAEDYLSMDAYAFSVDDAVGFMSELGDGLVFTVGGSGGLANNQHFNYADGFSVAIGVPVSMLNKFNTPLIKKYGACVINRESSDPNCESDKQDVIMPTGSQIAGFRIGTVADYPIKVRFTDLRDNVYTFIVSSKFAPCPEGVSASQCPTNRPTLFNKAFCVVTNSKGTKHPKSDDWCQNANPNQQREKQLTKNYLSFPQPVDYMP
ncbi:hypothetical protein [Paraburkholderia sp. RL17-373-BIF-A]|uniref:hypothetical protein n=1 Tax=Paraburkholderia sp. RL17-373-BIF-A TaxID=3031629 RepID=UPI0038BCE9DB